jgi:hypothetical protein
MPNKIIVTSNAPNGKGAVVVKAADTGTTVVTKPQTDEPSKAGGGVSAQE